MDAKDFGQLLKDHPEMLDDSKKLAAILRDIYPREKGNVNLIITACNAGVVSMLRKSELDSLLTLRIINLLMDDYAIAEEKARWAAELWMDAYSFFTTGTLTVKTVPLQIPEPVTNPAETVEWPIQPVKAQPPTPISLQKTSPDYFNVKENDSGCTITNYIGPKNGQIIIPEEINGRSVTEIGEYAFLRCTDSNSIIIPNSVTKIEECAFQGCTGLISIAIPDNITEIGEWTFYCCSSLTGVTIPRSVTKIGKEAFYGCVALPSVAIPESVTKIGTGAFEKCTNLTSITIPKSVTEIGDHAFGRTGLTSITIPDSVTKIGVWAFCGCNSLTSIAISGGVKKIGARFFLRCTSLTEVTIPDSVTEIGWRAFEGCTGLTSVSIPESVTKIDDAFLGCTNLIISAPAGSYAEKYAEEQEIPFCAI